MMKQKKRCIVMGATGLIGQQFIRLLQNHPNFELTNIYASSNSSSKLLGDVWKLPNYEAPRKYSDMIIEDLNSLTRNEEVDIAFSGLPSDIALPTESGLRKNGVAVFSNASAHRMDVDVPILIPEINQDHLNLIDIQRDNYDCDGFIVTNANCSVTGAAIYLHELRNHVDISTNVITTYQAQSGAGYNGLSNQKIINNVFPFIKNEEEKISVEANKILGKITDASILEPMQYEIIANCARVNVQDGHLEAITTIPTGELTKTQDQIISEIKSSESPLNGKELFTAPRKHILYLDEEDRPQPKIDSYWGDTIQEEGMSLLVGRLRVNRKSISSFVLVHNTIRGGAGGSILNAELALHKGYLK